MSAIGAGPTGAEVGTAGGWGRGLYGIGLWRKAGGLRMHGEA